MSGYGVMEARIYEARTTPKNCRQCEDTGFVVTVYGLRECPLCEEESEEMRRTR